MKIHFHASTAKKAQDALAQLIALYGQSAPEDSDVLVILGGDGTMLDALHDFGDLKKPYYGLNFGSVGFLMNPYGADNLPARLGAAAKVQIHPLRMKAVDQDGKIHEALAFNEVALLRETRQTARLRVLIDGVVRIPELVCDGILLATPAGSTAYNLSAQGPILPLSSNLLALTPISAFRPRRWRGALIPSPVKVRIDILNNDKRPVSLTADSHEVRNVVSVDIHQSASLDRVLMFDPDHHLEERMLKEQFLS